MTTEAQRDAVENEIRRREIEAATRLMERRREVTLAALGDVFGAVTMAESDAFLQKLSDRDAAVVVVVEP